MNTSLTTALSLLSNNSSNNAGEWVNIEQKDYEDPSATQGEVANLIDSLYDIDPCSATVEAENLPDVWGDPDVETFDLIVQEEMPPEFCDVTEDSMYTTTLLLTMSNPSIDYKLIIDDGVILRTRLVTKEVEDRVVVENAKGYTLKYRVNDSLDYVWINKITLIGGSSSVVLDKTNRRSLTWEASISGTLEVKYETSYYEIDVAIPGYNGFMTDAKATVFYNMLVDDTDIKKPDVDTDKSYSKYRWCAQSEFDKEIVTVPFPDHDVDCFYEVTTNYLCECSKEIYTTRVTRSYTTCPERTRCYDLQTKCEKILGYKTHIKYVDCNEVDGDINNPEFYEEKCCATPSDNEVSLPSCVRKYSITTLTGLDPAVEADLKAKYKGVEVNFIGVYPEDGFCGETIVEQKLVARQCCENPPELYFTQTVDSSNRNEKHTFCADGGVPPYEWSVGDNMTVKESSEKCGLVTFTNCFCYDDTVVVTDSCGQYVQHTVTASESCDELFYDDVSSGTVVADNSSVTVYVDGGAPPFTISVSGQNFFTNSARTEYQRTQDSRSFTIYTTDACGFCSITITEDCGQSVSGGVLSTSGEWVRVEYRTHRGPAECPIIVPRATGSMYSYSYTSMGTRVTYSATSNRYGYSYHDDASECINYFNNTVTPQYEARDPLTYQFCKDYGSVGNHPVCPNINDYAPYLTTRTPFWNEYNPAHFSWWSNPPTSLNTWAAGYYAVSSYEHEEWRC